jgi:phosphatidylcholine synthase
MAEPNAASTSLQRLGAWAVHLYTATGALTAFGAMLAIDRQHYRAAFAWLAIATVVDTTDGALARFARVKERVPELDGGRLDDIVDYLTYVFVPVLLLYHAGLLPPRWGLVPAAAALLSSAYGFASVDAKSNDYFFTGFPSYWNIVALYLFAARVSPDVNALVLFVLSGLVFVRTGYVYPSRTPVLRSVTTILGIIWAVLVLAMIHAIPDVPRPLLIGSLFFPVYYFVLSVVLHSRRQRS